MNENEIRRLSFIKYLYSLGISQSNQPDPLCTISILSFHDSIELFLHLVAEKYNVGKSGIPFLEYWKIINDKRGENFLTYKESMRQLNESRKSLKHGGQLVHMLDIESHRAATKAFFDENCKKIFDLEFDDISLIDMIRYERVRNQLKSAKEYFNSGDVNKTLESFALAFEYLLQDFEATKTDKYNRSIFDLEGVLNVPGSFEMNVDSLDSKYSEFVDKISDAFDKVKQTIIILGFGIDYIKYVRFKLMLPVVLFTASGKQHYTSFVKDYSFEKDSFDFCVNFIVESSLKLQEYDFEIQDE
ncbi:MAG: hypothetical protein QQN41_09725 [Nitrosopumilus sp.]